VLIGLALAAAPSAAQQAAAPSLLTWEDCVALALRRNPELASSRFSEAARRAAYRGSYNGLMPSLSLSNAYSDSSASPVNKWSAQATASMDLLNASDIADIRSSAALLSQAQAGRRAASANVRFGLRQAFAQTLFAQRNLEVSRDIRDMRARGASMVALRYDSGRESKGNMLRAKAQLAQAEADLNQAVRRLRVEARTLERQLGVDGYQAVVATGALSAAAAPPLPADPAALLAGRPDVSLQQAAVASARAGLSGARSTLWPSLSGSYTRGRAGRKEFPGGPYSWSGALTLSFPLFGGGPTSTYYAIKAASRGLDSAEQDLRSVTAQAVVDLEATWASYAGTVDQVAVQRALLAAARQRNEEADVRYASGLLTYDSWEIIASDRIGTERQAVNADLNAVVSQAAWERALGKELGE
jgi:outer membrane protein TolC